MQITPFEYIGVFAKIYKKTVETEKIKQLKTPTCVGVFILTRHFSSFLVLVVKKPC